MSTESLLWVPAIGYAFIRLVGVCWEVTIMCITRDTYVHYKWRLWSLLITPLCITFDAFVHSQWRLCILLWRLCALQMTLMTSTSDCFVHF